MSTLGVARKRWRTMPLAFVVAAMLASSAPSARAAITAPVNGAIVRGQILINEDRGGVSDSTCQLAQQLFGAPLADSTISVTRMSDGGVVLSGSKGGEGAWSTVWDSRNELANGFFRIKSVAKDRRATFQGGFCFGSVNVTLSDITVYLENFTPFVDDLGAGTILINPYLKMFRFTSPAYDSGNKSDPSMQIAGVPAAPAAPAAPCDPAAGPADCAPATPPTPGVDPTCGDPTAAGFLPFVLENGPQGCLSPNPLPDVTPPGPPNPPPPPSSQCDIPGTGGCGDALIAIDYDDATLSLTGVFDSGTRVFTATVVTKPGGTTYPLSHVPAPA